MNNNEYYFTFEAPIDISDKLASDLIWSLKDAERCIRTDRTSAGTQDIGTVIIAVIGSQAAVELAKGLANWMLKHRSSKVTVVRDGGRTEVRAEGLSSDQVFELAEEALTGKEPPRATLRKMWNDQYR